MKINYYQGLTVSLSIALAIVLGGCAAVSTLGPEASRAVGDEQAVPKAAPPQPRMFETIDQRAYHHYVNGLLLEGLEDRIGASNSYRQAWKYCPESAEIGLAYARVLIQLQDYRQALQALGHIKPVSADRLKLEARSFRGLGDADRAKQAYLDLLAFDTTFNTAYMFLAGYYQQKGDLDSAIWGLTNLGRTMPENPEVQHQLGRAQVARGNLPQARKAFRRSIELESSDANLESVVRLAQTFESEGQPDSAAAVFEAALEHSPDNAHLYNELARVWLSRDSVAKALPYLRNVARLAPDDFLARRRLGIMLMAVDSLAAADSVLTELVAAGDADPANHFYLGRLAILTRDYGRARDELTQVTRTAAAMPDAWLALGFTYRQLGQPEEEINTYQAGLLKMREETTAIQLYFALGAAFEQSGQVDSAIAAFEEILDHDPDHAASLNYLGYTLADRGIRLEYARGLLERAVALQPNNAAFLDSYGWVFYRLGRYDLAIQYLSSAAELDSDPVIYDHFGDALQARGETDRAREWWRKALEQQPENEAIREKLNR